MTEPKQYPHPRSHEFHELYANLPVVLRREVCCLVNYKGFDEPLSWYVVKIEVDNNTKIGYQAIEKLIEIKVI
jgi:hypothetical protein